MSKYTGAEKFAAEAGVVGREREFVGAGGSGEIGMRGKWLHLIMDGQEVGELVHTLVARYAVADRAEMERAVETAGAPVWLVETFGEYIEPWGDYGHARAKFWNSGAGWQEGAMPAGRLVRGEHYAAYVLGDKREEMERARAAEREQRGAGPVTSDSRGVRVRRWVVEEVVSYGNFSSVDEAEARVEELREEWAASDSGQVAEYRIVSVDEWSGQSYA